MLGVTEHRFLDLHDVDWHTPLPAHGSALVEAILRDVAPNTVLTFGPEGVTGHVGHQSVHEWAATFEPRPRDLDARRSDRGRGRRLRARRVPHRHEQRVLPSRRHEAGGLR